MFSGSFEWKTRVAGSSRWTVGVGNRNANKQSQRPKVHLHNFPALGRLGAPLAAKSKASTGRANKKTKKTLAILLMRSTMVWFPVHTLAYAHA